MGQILHGCAKTTAAVRIAIQNSKESLKKRAKQHRETGVIPSAERISYVLNERKEQRCALLF